MIASWNMWLVHSVLYLRLNYQTFQQITQRSLGFSANLKEPSCYVSLSIAGISLSLEGYRKTLMHLYL